MELAWFKKIRKPKQAVEHKRIQVPEGLWVKCNSCKEIIYKKEVLRNSNVCPKCNYHFRISARERLTALFDDRGIIEKFAGEVGSERMLFGTDLPWFDPHQAVGVLLTARISDEDRHNICHRNAEKLLAPYL